MERQILVPLDGSLLAETVLPHAALLARATDSHLTLLQTLLAPALIAPMVGVLPPAFVTAQFLEADPQVAQNYLTPVAQRLEAAGLVVRTLVVEGDPATTMVAWAAQDPPQRRIAIATHGRSGLSRWVFGSVAEKVIQAAPCPILLVRAERDAQIQQLPARPYHRIVVPLDGSALAERALNQAGPLALAAQASLLLVTVVSPGDDPIASVEGLPQSAEARRQGVEQLEHYLQTVAERLRSMGVTVETRIAYGQPAEGILHCSAEADGDLIVIASHGRSGLQRFWLGSVALKVVQSAQRPVLLVRM